MMDRKYKKAILFDKDGTLIEYNDLWTNAIFGMVMALDKKFSRKSMFDKTLLYQQLGILETHVSDASPLGTGTTAQIASVLQHFFLSEEAEMLAFVRDYLYQYTLSHQEELVPIGDLPQLLQRLKAEGYMLGIVTSDDYESTLFTLKVLEIKTYFDVVVTGDRFEPKPNREALRYASSILDVLPQNILFVGDSSVDAQFSRHCGMGAGVTSGLAYEEELRELSPYIYQTIHDIPYQDLFTQMSQC